MRVRQLAVGLSVLGIIMLTAVLWAHFRQPTVPMSPVEMIPDEQLTATDRILLGARAEVRNRVRYDAGYYGLQYPGGDVPADRGACTDVVIRALRAAGCDLQVLIHEDMRERFDSYPQIWDLTEPDPNIDHRRTQNQIVFLKKYGLELTTDPDLVEQWRHGDIVYWRFPNGNQHTGIISDRTNSRGQPLVIHNTYITREEDCLTRWEIIGHFRFPR
ncbi:MAG: DUF1287 domain-containing protein [Bacillota bacterium]